ncbi:helix-turn-helix transcriptional regulator [Streptomyces sp. A1499]|uniref:helix-turn-helix domain-containing protein n=1 Tax=Streptomyces sp. A1499 TaxID=2563104 RepID=UPI00109EDE58|nr:helix-turn-helix transcriptional regulator [Streptomyces sp. A1499]THC53430.1 XRE family transcriptional regulator [Streptomyces sp. A1499]
MGAGDLAELLRELKERSGLSYGVLAKRLHVSTSTLHRYVQGAAVPTEFAPLERLARVCGASREEMVEVHRRWILADASRGDRKEGEQQPSGPSGPAAVAPDAAVAPSPEREAPAAGSQAPAPGGDSGFDGSDDGDPGIVIGPATTVAGRREGRRLPRARVLVAAGIVVALGATAVAVQAASGGGGGSRERASVGSPSVTGSEGEWGRGATGSASPSGKESRKASDKDEPGKDATASAKPDGAGEKGRGRAGASGGGDGGKGGGSAARGGVPVTVSTQAQYWQDPCGHPYLVDKGPGVLSPPPNEQDAASWVAANGGVSAGEQTVKLTVQGTGKETVVLESLNVRVAGSGAPLAWNNYKMGYLGVGCGGNVPQHSFDVNLDAAVPRPTPQQGESGFPYKVSASDPEAFYINATADSRYVRWYLELEWSSGARRGTVRIDDTGKPFATSGDKGRPVYGYSLDTKKWTKTNRNDDQGQESTP